MANVTKVSPWTMKDGGKAYYVGVEGQEDVPCFDASAESLEIGKPLPEGWEVATSKAGKKYLRPPGKRKRDYTPRWTDTEEGAKWADDRINRRRALELAVSNSAAGVEDPLALAATFYTFLKSADIEPATPSLDTSEGSSAVGMVDAAGGSPAYGEDAGDPSTTDPRKDFRRYLAETYTTADAVLMARALFQTKVRKVPNLMGLELEELQAIDAEFKARKIEAPA